MRFLKPLDTSLLDEVCAKYDNIITIEDGVIRGGFGWSVEDYIRQHKLNNNITCLGLPDKFIEHGSVSELQKLCGIDVESITETIRQIK